MEERGNNTRETRNSGAFTLAKPHCGKDAKIYIIVGTSRPGRLLIAFYTERGDAIRLISARELTANEREAYEEN